jgi:putative ABC transport system permease protein
MLKGIRRHPARAILTVLTLALGLGATTAIVSAIRGVLLAPLPYPRAEQLVTVREVDTENDGGTVGFATFAEWRRSARSFSSLSAIATRSYTLTGDGDPEQLAMLGVTHETFATFGVRPQLGRGFSAADDVRGAPRVVVLSHELWSRRYGGDESIAGRTIRMSGQDFEVIGVMPPRSRMREVEWRTESVAAWVPLRYNESLEWACRSCRHLRVVGRLREGVGAEAAAREIETLTAAMRRAHPNDYPSNGWTTVDSLHDAVVGRKTASSLWIVLGVAALVLLAAIANAGSLRLSELFVRHDELVVRQSLGATPGRIARMLVGESVAQALLAAAVGIALAVGALAWLRAHASAFLPRAADLEIDATVVAASVALAVACGAIIGIIPALRARRWSLVVNNRGLVAGRTAAQQILVGVNIALSVVLLAGSTLVLRSVWNLFSTPPGFDPAGVVSFRVSADVPEEQLLPLYQRFLFEGRQVSGVTSLALTSQLPFAENDDNAGMYPEDRAGVMRPGDAPDAQRFAVSAEYFDTLRIPMLRGRSFTDLEREPVIILNETAARTLWPDGDAIGKRVRLAGGANNPFRVVVGVAGNVAPGDLGAPAPSQAYLPLAQFTPPEVTGIARTTSGAAPLRDVLRRIAPDVPFYRIAALTTLIERSEARRQFVLACLSAFSTVVLVLAMVGVYGILSLFVTSRRRELALRIALGASSRGMFRLVLSQGVRLASIAILAGLGVSLVLGRFLTALLHGVEPHDPATLASVAALLVFASIAACALPAWRAARVSPEAALRDE